MRVWLTALIFTAILAIVIIGRGAGFRDALEMRTMLATIEGAHHLDLIVDGRLEGSYASEFRRLPDGGFLSRYDLKLSSPADNALDTHQSLEFSGFPSYSLRAVRIRRGTQRIEHRSTGLPRWRLYDHLILQRLAIEGAGFLDRAPKGVEVLAIGRTDGGVVRASIKAPVFDAREASISFTELEVEWPASDGVVVRRDGGWFDYDRSGRIRRAQLTPHHQLVAAGRTAIGSGISPAKTPANISAIGETNDRSMIPVMGLGIEHPGDISKLVIKIGEGSADGLDGDDYLPVQSLDGDLLTLRAGPLYIPEKIDKLVALVHRSLVYDESFNTTDIDQIIANGRGDCTEFTDLFDAKAKSAGIDTRKILGLAYLDDYQGRPPGFYVHAWNQVLVNGDWVDVDATWNQAPASPARIRFAQDASHLTMLHKVRGYQFELVQVRYAVDDGSAEISLEG